MKKRRVEKKTKVLIAMSGGVDSSVAAVLLLKKGYEVTGAFMVNYDTNTRMYANDANYANYVGNNESCWLPDYWDAVRVAAKLGILLLRLDFRKEYKKFVLDYMFREYRAGRTPNPDVLCNKFIKFGAWLNTAKKLGFDKLATGHYARIKKTKNQKNKKTLYDLMCAKDGNKDQTYFLHQLTQEQMKDVLFPLGDYTKEEVRKMARKYDLPVANKEESMGICFVGEVDMKEFLKTKIKPKPGKIVISDGRVVGEHEGLAFYTIGQRIGGSNIQYSILNIQKGDTQPLFVLEKDVIHNKLIVGYEDDPLLYKKEIAVKNVNWISGFIRRSPQSGAGHPPKFPLKCEVRLRHRQPLQKCLVTRICELNANVANYANCDNNVETQDVASLRVIFEKQQRAATSGQFAVFYKDNECLGGGEIV